MPKGEMVRLFPVDCDAGGFGSAVPRIRAICRFAWQSALPIAA